MSNLNTELLDAAKNGDFEKVKRLISEGANVNAQDAQGQTPLHLAIENGKKKIVAALLKVKGIDVDKKNSYGNTPLHSAVSKDNKEIVDALLKAHADVNVENNDGNTPLHLTATFDYAKIAEALLEANAKVNAADKGGETTLHLAAEFGRVDIVKALLKGIDVDKMNSDGETPLHLAAKFGYVNIVRALLDKEADINVVNRDGSTPPDLTDNGEIKALLQSVKDANDDTDIPLSSKPGAESTTQTEEQTSTFFDSFFSMLTEPISLVVLFFGGLISWLFWPSTEKTAGHVEQSYDQFGGLNDSDYNDQNDLHLFQ